MVHQGLAICMTAKPQGIHADYYLINALPFFLGFFHTLPGGLAQGGGLSCKVLKST